MWRKMLVGCYASQADSNSFSIIPTMFYHDSKVFPNKSLKEENKIIVPNINNWNCWASVQAWDRAAASTAVAHSVLPMDPHEVNRVQVFMKICK